MSSCYYHFVIPAAESWEFCPSNAQLVEVFQFLRKSGWVEDGGETVLRRGDPQESKPKRSIVKRLSAVERQLGQLGEHEGFSAACWRPQGRPSGELRSDGLARAYDFEEKGLILPDCACAVELRLTRLLTALPPASEMDLGCRSDVPCSGCGERVVMPVSLLWGKHADTLVEDGYGLPRACPHCAVATQPGSLIAHDRNPQNGKRFTFRVPFYRFALVLEPVAKAHPHGRWPARTDPELLGALREICGVEFRAHGRIA